MRTSSSMPTLTPAHGFLRVAAIKSHKKLLVQKHRQSNACGDAWTLLAHVANDLEPHPHLHHILDHIPGTSQMQRSDNVPRGEGFLHVPADLVEAVCCQDVIVSVGWSIGWKSRAHNDKCSCTFRPPYDLFTDCMSLELCTNNQTVENKVHISHSKNNKEMFRLKCVVQTLVASKLRQPTSLPTFNWGPIVNAVKVTVMLL